MSLVVLVVDDDDCYPLLLPRVIQAEHLEISLHYAADGEKAIQYLSGEGEYENRSRFPFPSIVLLDLKMPRIDGFEVLEWKQKQPELRSLPVVVWSSSTLLEDREKAL